MVEVPRSHPLIDWGAYDALRSVFLWIWTAQPNGAIGMQLKSCGTLRYTYDDNFGVAFACRSTFTCIYVCGMSLSHRISWNNFSIPHKMNLKCPLNVFITFSAKFLRCIPDGTNSYSIPFPFIFLRRHLIFQYWVYVSFSWCPITSVCWVRSGRCLSSHFLF